ncbi:helix-hairpin-helix domain-containing protein [Aquimarina sp. AD10]|uniref:ComEA family DNA-binding protein n=1 Tax=Aquimarina sp. AD10 TaxID=1714849 RepID=UPI000E47A16A|nr:helix-hairpin-helix domain-containing protein [Aquimarina sp. AD10]AXT60705.1 helix-hairpin-helix domain-containing protein [Aquimarina sp. AD10]RKM95732.1 helix-hairpin-helix domain-containing protein [Aquimarina sp. AD10]
MNNIKSHFDIHSRFRNGIFILTLILLVSILGYFFYPKSTHVENDLVELTTFQVQIDSLKSIAEQKKQKFRLKPFNPNFISDYKGYQLGLSPDELDRIYRFRKQDKWINSISDFKKVSGVSDSLLKVIAPLFKFPEWKKKKTAAKKSTFTKPYTEKEDLNKVLAKQLIDDLQVPDFIAERTIKYRNKIGGFLDDEQLKDIKGLYDFQRKKILSNFTVKSSPNIKKINLNSASVKDLIEIPYFDFETALEITDFIKKNGSVSNFNELGKIEGFSLEKIDRIALYLTLN